MGLLSPTIREYLRPHAKAVRGKVLDVGCGNLPYRKLFSQVDEYVALDRERRFPEDVRTDVVFEMGVAEKLPFGESCFDAILATQLIEHLPEPILFFGQARRVLKAGGTGIITFPLVNPLHELPYDYWRYTEYGVRDLCDRCDLSVESVEPMGGGWMTIGFILYQHFYDVAERQLSVRKKSFYHRIGTGLFRILCSIDKRYSFPELPVNYLLVFKKKK
jgi:SAM-dependent methyltransferase